MEAIPLKERLNLDSEFNDSSSRLLESPYSNTTITTDQTRKGKSRIKQSFRSRQNSTYIKRSRLSRYKNAMASALPVRLTTATNEELLPIDTVGCFSNASFYWSRKFFQNKIVLEGEEYKVPRASNFDSADVNSKRLLGKFKDNLQKHGTAQCSMLKVAFQFCSTRIIIAILIHIFAIVCEILGPTLFLKFLLESVHDYPNLELQEDQIFLVEDEEPWLSKEDLLLYSVLGFTLSLPVSYFLKYMVYSINLRTANRLRTGILSAMFKRAIKSKISNNIAVHQIMTFTTEDSAYIFNLIEKSTLLIGLCIGIVCASVASIILLGFPGLWPLFVIFPLFCILIFSAKISTRYNLQSEMFNSKKLTVIEELCMNFRNILMLGFEKMFRTDFEIALHSQSNLLIWKEIFSPKVFGYVTSAMLMGGLYLNWCDVAIETNIVGVLVLIILFSCLVKRYMMDIADAIQSIVDAAGCLEKVKDVFTLEIAEQSMSKPKKEYFVTIENALFSWPHKQDHILMKTSDFHLRVEQFYVRRGDIVGVVGNNLAGKTTLAYSILGHTVHKHGDVRVKEKIEFYPTQPCIIDGSVKENILMGSEFDSQKFYSVIVDTKLDKDVLTSPGFENIHIMSMDLKPHQIQRIVLARALYSDSVAFIFDEPFKNIWKSMEMCNLVKNAFFKLQIQEKTIILISNSAEFLSVCQYIHYLESGQLISDTGTRGTYESFIELPEFQDVLITQKTLETANGFQETLDGSNANGLALKKRDQNSNVYQDLEETQPERFRNNYKPNRSPLSFCRLFIITNLLFISTFGYFILPVSFIKWHDYKDPWLAYVCSGIILATILIDILVKYFYASSCETRARRQQFPIFDKLLKTSISFLATSHVSNITSMFMMTNFLEDASEHIFGLISVIGISFSAVILVYTNYWTGIVIGVQLILTLTIYFKYRNSIKYYVKCEMSFRDEIFLSGVNMVRNRAILASGHTENTNNLLKRLYTSIEDNSSSIFLQKSIAYHAQFLNQFLLWLTFMGVLLILLFLGPSKGLIFNITLGIFGNYTFVYFNEMLLKSFLNSQKYYEKCCKIHENVMKIEVNEVKSPKKPIIELYRGMSLEMFDLGFSMVVRQLIDLHRLQAEPGEKIGVVGDGGNLVASFLAKVIKPTRGDIKLNQISLEQYSNSGILFAFIPFNPRIDGVTINMLLDPDGAFQRKNYVQDALRMAKLSEYVFKLPRVLEEPINNLPRERRQQLCLAKCFIKKTVVEKLILVVEYPHPDLVKVLEMCTNNELADNTIIVIAGMDGQLNICDTVFQTEDLLLEQELATDKQEN